MKKNKGCRCGKVLEYRAHNDYWNKWYCSNCGSCIPDPQKLLLRTNFRERQKVYDLNNY